MVNNLLLAAGITYASLLNVQFVRAYDADTITVNIPYVHPLLGHQIGVRILGIDAPEIRGKCLVEKEKALIARDYVRQIMKNAKKIDLMDISRDRYFRILAKVRVDGLDIGNALIRKGYAVPYDGKSKRKDWCDED